MAGPLVASAAVIVLILLCLNRWCHRLLHFRRS
jgi:hypothetical protein